MRCERCNHDCSEYESFTGLCAACEAEDEAKERATCSRCLARTYRQEECICEDGGDAEDFDVVTAGLSS